MSIDIERVKKYNASYKEAQSKALQLRTELDMNNKEIDRLCGELSKDLGEPITRENISEVYTRYANEINQKLTLGEQILQRIANEANGVGNVGAVGAVGVNGNVGNVGNGQVVGNVNNVSGQGIPQMNGVQPVPPQVAPQTQVQPQVAPVQPQVQPQAVPNNVGMPQMNPGGFNQLDSSAVGAPANSAEIIQNLQNFGAPGKPATPATPQNNTIGGFGIDFMGI